MYISEEDFEKPAVISIRLNCNEENNEGEDENEKEKEDVKAIEF